MTISRLTHRPDSGASVVEAAILLPMLMLLTMVIFQAGIWFHARNLAVTAANKGVDAARVEQGTAGDGQRATAQFLNGTGVLRDPEIEVQRGADSAEVTVSGDVVSLIFGVGFQVSVRADAPVERVLP